MSSDLHNPHFNRQSRCLSAEILAQPPIFLPPHDLASFIFLPQVVIVDTITLTSILMSWLIIDIANVSV